LVHLHYWSQEVHLFLPLYLLLQLCLCALLIVSLDMNSDTWVSLFLQLLLVLVTLVMLPSLMWKRLFYVQLCFYLSQFQLLVVVANILLWLTIFARDLRHDTPWLWWLNLMLMIAEFIAIVCIAYAYANFAHKLLIVGKGKTVTTQAHDAELRTRTGAHLDADLQTRHPRSE
jgi:hypothetical protein